MYSKKDNKQDHCNGPVKTTHFNVIKKSMLLPVRIGFNLMTGHTF